MSTKIAISENRELFEKVKRDVDQSIRRQDLLTEAGHYWRERNALLWRDHILSRSELYAAVNSPTIGIAIRLFVWTCDDRLLVKVLIVPWSVVHHDPSFFRAFEDLLSDPETFSEIFDGNADQLDFSPIEWPTS
jgi:hypothetical protein